MMMCRSSPPARSEAKPIYAVIQPSSLQHDDCSTLVMTESSVTAVATLNISRRKRCRCCPCAVAQQIRYKTISAVKLSQFTHLEAYVDLSEGVSA